MDLTPKNTLIMRRRVRLWMVLFSGAAALMLMVHLSWNWKPCEIQVGSRREVFQPCSGCFSTGHLPVVLNQPELCQSHDVTVDLIFVVYTKVHDVAKRNLIRSTWASVTRNNTSNFRHAFMLGMSCDDEVMRAVRSESDVYKDIIVTDFHDSYENLTLKSMTTLRWLARHCANARFFQKVDDDVWINTPVMVPTLNKFASALQKGLGGDRKEKGEAIRDSKSRWYASCDQYPDTTYPHYAHGPTYVGTPSMAHTLSTKCQDMPFFHLEDVFLGLCQEMLGLQVVDIPEMDLWPKPKLKRRCEGKNRTVAAVFPVPTDAMWEYWRAEPCE